MIFLPSALSRLLRRAAPADLVPWTGGYAGGKKANGPEVLRRLRLVAAESTLPAK